MIYILKKLREEKSILIFLAALGMIRAMHEISKFRINQTWLPIWDYPFNYKNIPLDSYHFYGGLFALLLIAGLRTKLNWNFNKWYETIFIVCFEYLFYFYSFDVFYHFVFMKFSFMQFDYLIPLLTLFTR